MINFPYKNRKYRIERFGEKMKNVRFSKRLLSLILSVIMILGCFSASFSVTASAAEWKTVSGVTYDPVTVYVQTSTLTAGKTYLIAIGSSYANKVINAVNTTVTLTDINRNVKGNTGYYTTDDGSDKQYTASDRYVVDESNIAFVNNEFLWNSGKLYNSANKKYFARYSSSNVRNSSSTSNSWTFSDSMLSYTNSSGTKYVYNNGTSLSMSTSTTATNTKVTAYEKVQLYKKIVEEGSNYKYVGETAFAADFEGTFDENVVLNSIAILHKQPGENIPDEECAKLTIKDAAVSFKWNTEVNVNKIGTYTGTVYVNGQALQTITVYVQEHAQVNNGLNDPSTARVENQFSLTEADDGKMASDKTVKYMGDEFDAFENYAEDEFSVALSALGQSYKIVETEETEIPVKVHPDVVFVLDASGSMRQFTVAGSTTVTRGEATSKALNAAIKELYEADPETRVGIVTYGMGVDPGVLLPLDKYTLPEGQTDYITWGGRMVAKQSTSNTNNNLAFDVKTVSSSKSISDIKKLSRYPGLQSVNNVWSYYKPAVSEMTTIATVNGVTYYAAYRDGIVFLFTSNKEESIARLVKTPSGSTAQYPSKYTNDDISITCTGSNSITYTTNSYAKKTGNINLSFEANEYMMATNFLINSKGEVIKPSCHHFVIGVGTFTQAGLQRAENMFAATGDKKDRVPALVLISDGIPTVSDVNVNNPQLEEKDGVTTGYGLSGNGTNSTELCTHGLRTIETAMKTKKNINSMYESKGLREALFYTIGPGVDYIFGQTVLDPTNENIEAASKQTTNVGQDTESGMGVPSELAATISAKYTDLTYVDYADWSFTGDMSSEELTTAFRKIVTSIVDTTRPVVTTRSEYIDDVSGAMVFTDVIGNGMKLNSEPVIRYANVNYAPTDKKTTTLEDGTQVTSYTYDYRVNEESTKKAFNLKGLTVMYVASPDGKETVKWYIPAELIPIIAYDGFDEVYVPVSPIRLIYKVDLKDEFEMVKGTYYTNSVTEPANVEFNPAVGNPYYYKNELGTDKKMHSTLKKGMDESIRKITNTTDTAVNSHETKVSSDGKVETKLGNNGIIEVLLTTLELKKVWDDGNNVTGQRPDSITVQIYRNGAVYGEPRTIYGKDCDIIKGENGEDIWVVYFRGLPFSEGFEYTMGEYSIPDHDIYVSSKDNEITITNKLKRGYIEYELYLVDNNGNPVNKKGQPVDFENRTTMSDLVEVTSYIHTTTVIDLDEIEALLPNGYYVYNTNTSYTEKFEGVDSPLNEAKVVDHKDNRTTVISVPETAEIGENGIATGMGSFERVKVSFAIAKIEILPDVIVVDYGKTILTSPLDNDSGAIRLLGLGSLDSESYTDSYTSQNGVFRVEGDNVTFSPFSYMSSVNRVQYFAEVVKTSKETQVLSSTISVIPATTVYYEDDFGGNEENGGIYIQYSGDWYTIDDNGNKVEGVTANTDTDDRQDRGEVGQGNIPYGYDSSYENSTKFCNGTAATAEGKTVLIDGKPVSNATATFTFTGTGFDVISRTDLDCGMITVLVNKHDTGEYYTSVPVVNKGTNSLYQIPVVSFEGMPYDTYDVKITVNAPSKMLGITGSTFYLDAIRIYNPMGLNDDENVEFSEANAAYNKDKEANAFTELIRNCLISADNLDVTDSYGAVFVDTLDDYYIEGGMIGNIKSPDYTPEEIRTRMLDPERAQNMQLIGPNEELYLSRGYGVGFIAESSVIPESVQLEIKLPQPKNNLFLAVQTYGDIDSVKYISVNSATEMYYDISDAVRFTKIGDMYRATVIIANLAPIMDSETLEDIISVTNLKMTYSDGMIVAGGEPGHITAEDENKTVRAALVANKAVYLQSFDTVYVQTVASTPTFDVVNAEADEVVSVGEPATIQFNTANFVEDVEILGADGKPVELQSLECDVDESKILSDDYLNTKTWTATFVPEDEGQLELTVQSAEGEGESANVTVNVKPAHIVSLKVASAPAKTNYKYGDKIDVSGLVLEAKYSDGSTKQIRSGYTLSTNKANHLGQKTIQVSFDGMTASFKIKTTFSLAGLIKSIFSK